LAELKQRLEAEARRWEHLARGTGDPEVADYARRISEGALRVRNP
jgi:hypothetical protein